ncbi:MAG TPA: hypothetical protein VG944_16710 [Fimbriimonas sp.]|nr:hypothetical protein [Fimbriimonas sp.]
MTRNGVPSTISVDNNDKYLSGDGWSMSSYDGDGNPGVVNNSNPGGKNLTIQYDQWDKPAIINNQATESIYCFDADGRQVQRFPATGGYITQVFDGASVIVENIFSGSGNTIYRLPGVGEYSTANGQSYQMEDVRGSALGETNHTTSSYAGEYDYDGYGVEADILAPPTGTTSFRFAGKHGYQLDSDWG